METINQSNLMDVLDLMVKVIGILVPIATPIAFYFNSKITFLETEVRGLHRETAQNTMDIVRHNEILTRLERYIHERFEGLEQQTASQSEQLSKLLNLVMEIRNAASN